MPDNTSLDSSNAVARLMILQTERMKAMKGTLSNFRMDSGKANVKKTKSYYDKRLEKIENTYKEFQDDHKILLFSAELNDDYFKNNSASLFEEVYLEVYCALVDDREDVLGTPSTSSASNSAQGAPVIRIVSSSATHSNSFVFGSYCRLDSIS